VPDLKTAVIVSVGTELTEGIIQEKHLKYLAPQLRIMGFDVLKSVMVPDNFTLVQEEISNAVGRCSLLIVTGGLGPTSDDITREVVSKAAGTGLYFREEIWEIIKNRYKGRTISPVNKKQAMFPEGFSVLDNKAGTAPGMAGWIHGTCIIVLPGPPRELKVVFENSALPFLEKYFNFSYSENSLTCSSYMTPESELEESLKRNRIGNIIWGTRVSGGYIEFHLKGGTGVERRKMLKLVRKDLGELKIRTGNYTPAELFTAALKGSGLKTVTAESCTGGLISKLITDIPGSSEFYWGGYVTYSNQAKQRILNIPHPIIEEKGAVSREVCRGMAEEALEISGADISIAVSGIAGPGGGTAEKPVGTVWISVLNGNGDSEDKLFQFFGNRVSVRMKTAVSAFLLAEKMLIGLEWLDRYQRW